jgi:hypothetical protein
MFAPLPAPLPVLRGVALSAIIAVMAVARWRGHPLWPPVETQMTPVRMVPARLIDEQCPANGQQRRPGSCRQHDKHLTICAKIVPGIPGTVPKLIVHYPEKNRSKNQHKLHGFDLAGSRYGRFGLGLSICNIQSLHAITQRVAADFELLGCLRQVEMVLCKQ